MLYWQDIGLNAGLLFMDFDSVHRGILMKILTAYGIPRPIVRLIEQMYFSTIAHRTVLVLAGVKQGDSLASS